MRRAPGPVLSRLIVALLVIGGGLPGFTDVAAAWSDGPCPTSAGVTVVIDFQELGGGVHVRCASGPVSSGFEALRQAGIEYQTTVRFPGFLCKIAGKPANDPCVNASPASAYWSYWLAARGGQWCYSNWGAGNRTPPQGTVEGWSFSLNKSGSTSPPPRAQVPARVPGAPSALPANDCDQRTTAPTVPPTSAAPATPAPSSPAPVAPAVPASPDAPAPNLTPDAPGVAAAGNKGAAGGGGSAEPPVPSVAPDAVGEEPSEEGAEEVAGATDERNDDSTGPLDDPAAASSSAERAELAERVELGGGEGSGSPVAVLVTVVAVAALVAAAAVVRRRASTR